MDSMKIDFKHDNRSNLSMSTSDISSVEDYDLLKLKIK